MKKILITFSFGQSLSIGTSHNFETLSTTPQHPGLVLGLDFGHRQTTARGFRDEAVPVDQFAGFVDLVEGDRETPASGMLNQLIDRYLADGRDPPSIVHFHAGHGGRSILELLTSSSDIFATIDEALAVVPDGLHFAIENDDGTLAHYINNAGEAVFSRNTDGGTVYFDNLAAQLELAVQEAHAQGFEIETDVFFNWIQGQSDVALSRAETFNYSYHLNLLLDKVSATIAQIVAPDANMIASVSQFRGTGIREMPTQTLDVINAREDTHLGIVEYAFQAFEPAVIGHDYTHLSAEGYYRAGRLLGDRFYDAAAGNENQPILIDRIEYMATNELLVTFSGVETQLVNDPSIYRAEAGFSAPEHFGFGLYGATGLPTSGRPGIIASALVGENQVRLVFDQPISHEYRLYLGRTGENLIDPSISPNKGSDFGGTTLRDAAETRAPVPTSEYVLDDDAISEYAPIQAFQTQAWSIFGSDDDDSLNGTSASDTISGNGGEDLIDPGAGDDILSGGSSVDTVIFRGNFSEYTITQTSIGAFRVVGPDGTDALSTVEMLQFDDRTVRLLRGSGTAVDLESLDPATYQSALELLRDFDGNDLGGDGAWLRIGAVDINGDGDSDHILVNDAIGRFATIGTAPDNLVYFDDHSWGGETRVVGIYIDPFVADGTVEQGSEFDSQQRFQNDLLIENVTHVLGADDYDGDGVWEVYFGLTDGTAYLHALMHSDGNIRYANYQTEEQVREYLTANGFGDETFGHWFGTGQDGQPSNSDANIIDTQSALAPDASLLIGGGHDFPTEFFG